MILYIIKEKREELGIKLETLSKLSGINAKRILIKVVSFNAILMQRDKKTMKLDKKHASKNS